MVLLRVSFLATICCMGGYLYPNLNGLISNMNKPGSMPAPVIPTFYPVTPTEPETPIVPKPSVPVSAQEPGVVTPKAPTPPEEPHIVEPKAPIIPHKPVEPEPHTVGTPKEPPHIIVPKSPVVTPVVPKAPVYPGVPKTIEHETPAQTVHAPEPTVAKAPVVDAATVDIKIANMHQAVDDGLDTLHIDNGGNWLEKRIWYKKAEMLFEKIRKDLQQASDVRMKFIHSVNQVGQQIDEFYEHVGYQKGQIDELLQAVSVDLTTEQEIRGGDLSSDERPYRTKIKAEQAQFKAISNNFQLIENLDDQIDKTLMKAFKEIDACRSLETKAWNNFKDIGLELDDQKARVLYYEMDNFSKNIEQKFHYLQVNLLQYLQHQLISKVTQTIAQIKSAQQDLYTKGLDIQSALQKDHKGDFVVLKSREEMQVEAKARDAVQGQMTAMEHENAQDNQKEKRMKAELELAQKPWYQKWFCKMLEIVCLVYGKVKDVLCVALCCGQTVLCKLQMWICHLLGY